MAKEFTLTKEQFIKRSVNGEVFIHNNHRYYYDIDRQIPFRRNEEALYGGWNRFDGKTLFTLEKPEPIIERRYRWLKDNKKYTEISSCYFSEENAKNTLHGNGWYKSKNDYIDIET